MSYKHQEYPKQLYRSGWENLDDSVVVSSQEEEEAARADGFISLADEAPKKAGRPKKVAE